jgi:hypothetical protein
MTRTVFSLRRFSFRVVLIAVLITGGHRLLVQQAEALTNMVSNPGFESGTVGWLKITNGGRSVVTTTAHTGTRIE